MAPQQTRQIGEITRVYKNANNKAIAIDCIDVTANVLRLGSTTTDVRFHISIDKINTKRSLIHLGVDDRVVSEIHMIGDYDSITTDSGNYFLVTWNKASDNENDVSFSLEPYVAKIGDTL